MKASDRFLFALITVGCLSLAVCWQQTVQAQTSCVPTPSGLVAWYPGDGNANDIQNSYNGTLLNGVTFTPGKVGQAFSLDGANDYVEGPTNNFVSGALSIDAWVKPESDTAQNVSGAIISKYNSNANQISWALYYETGGRLRFVVSKDGANGNHFIDTVNPIGPPGVYTHIAATFNGSTQAMKIYVNSVEVPVTVSGPAVTSIFNSSTNLRIGAIIFSEGVLANFFKGTIDEVQVYNRELSAAEIQNIYNAAGAGMCKPTYVCTAPPANLVAWLPGDNNFYNLQSNLEDIDNGSSFVSFAPGKVGPAFSFDGSFSFVRVFNRANTLYPGSGSFTVDAWIRTTQTGGAPRILSRNECGGACPSGSAPSFYILNLNNGRLEGALRNSSNVTQTLTGTKVIADGLFHHVAMVRDTTAGQFRLYVDGMQEASAALTVTGTIKDDDGFDEPLVLGAQINADSSVTGVFAGLIDEVHYFNRTLSQAEIQSTYNAGSAGLCRSCTPPPANLNLWLPFDETLGTSTADLTNHISSATLRGGAAVNANGEVNGALDLSGANGDVKVVPGGAGLDYQDWQQQTISFWLNWGGARTVAQPGLTLTKRQYIWDNTDTNSNGFAAIIIDEPGAGSGQGVKAIGQPNTGGEVQAVAPLPTVGVWEHYTCIFDKQNATISIYKNGVFVSRSLWTPNVGTTSGAKYIGNAGPANVANTNDYHLRGKLDEFIVADAGMSDAEIQDIVNAGVGGVCKTLGNDNFANAQVLNGNSGKVAGSNFKATKEAGEPNHAGSAGGASVWYKWQAPFTGAVNFSTVLSDFDTMIAVYTGSSVNALTPMASNDDSASGSYFNAHELTSSVTFNAVAGTTYYIAVDGAQGRMGRISLAWGADVNISGQVSPGPVSLVLELSGDDHRAAPFPATGGTYNFQHLRAGVNYIVQIRFYHDNGSNVPCFSPPLYQPPIYVPLTSSVTNLNFTYLSDDCGSGAGSVAGLVKRGNGVGIPSITITITSSSFNRTVLTDSNGQYLAPNLPSGTSYTVTPSSPNITFTPANLMGNSDDDVLNADFTAADTVTIGGQTRNGSAPLSGTTISISGTRSFTLITDANGYYTTEVPAGGTYTVTAARTGVTFTPSSFPLNNVSANQKNVDFTASTGVLRIDSMSRRAGPTSGGQLLILNGAFTNLSSVMLGGVNTNWFYTNGPNDTTQITVTTPVHNVGAVSFDLVPAAGMTYTRPNAYAYLPTVFTDNTLTAGVTTAKAQHIIELRQAVDALRAVAGLSAAQWTDATLTPTSSLIRAVDITELRARLEEAAVALGYAQMNYTDPTLNSSLPIRRVHIEELRQRLRNIAG